MRKVKEAIQMGFAAASREFLEVSGIAECVTDFHVNFREFQWVSKVLQGVSESFGGLHRFPGELQEIPWGF